MNKIFNSIYEDFNSIETVKDLRKRGLTHADYINLHEALKELHSNNSTDLFSTSIAEYLSKKGCKVNMKGITYYITI